MLSIILLSIIIATALLVALDAERNRRARHRAQTSAILAYVSSLPGLARMGA